jgi:hypothetical protein
MASCPSRERLSRESLAALSALSVLAALSVLSAPGRFPSPRPSESPGRMPGVRPPGAPRTEDDDPEGEEDAVRDADDAACLLIKCLNPMPSPTLN